MIGPLKSDTTLASSSTSVRFNENISVSPSASCSDLMPVLIAKGSEGKGATGVLVLGRRPDKSTTRTLFACDLASIFFLRFNWFSCRLLSPDSAPTI